MIFERALMALRLSRLGVALLAISLAFLLVFDRVQASESDQQNFSVSRKLIPSSNGEYLIEIQIQSPLQLQRTGVRISADHWMSQKDFPMRSLGKGEYSVAVGPFQSGAEVEFAVFGEDAVAEQWIWDNYFRQNHRITVSSELPVLKVEELKTIKPAYSTSDFIAAVEAKKQEAAIDLRLSAAANEYLSRHKLYLSMTTSPKRIKHITQVISAIDLSKVEKIYINLPERFGRDGSVYQIPGELLNHPKVVINRIPVDLGPITKILPAAEIIQKIDADAWIISIDDDIHYNRYLIRDFANAKAAHPFAVISGSGQAADYWGISNFPGHAENYAIATKSTALSPVDIVEGFAGIIYRAGDLDVARLKQMSATSKAAFASDDLVLSYALGERGVQKLRLESRRYGTHAIHELEYGFQEDALHRGAGVTSTATEGNMNAEKYREAFRGLQKWKTPRCRTTELLKLLSPVPSSQ